MTFFLVNGDPSDLRVGTTVAGIVDTVAPSPNGIAVAVNGEVIPRSCWPETRVGEGDEVEVLGAARGG